MSISTWRYPCDYPYPYGDLHVTHNTLCVCIHMETWRHSMYISTWRHGDTHRDMDTLHVHIHMETWRYSMSISTWRHGDTCRHGDTPCPYPHDVETDLSPLVHLFVHLSTHLLFVLFKIQLDHSTSVIWLHVSDNMQTWSQIHVSDNMQSFN